MTETKNDDVYDWEGKNATISTSGTSCTITNPWKYENITITKKDNASTVLQGVKFIFYNETTGKYLSGSSGSWSYVSSKDDATQFTTNASGQITLTRVILGKYKAIEVYNPNDLYAWENVTEPIAYPSSASTAKNVTKDITNTWTYENITITKVDTDTGNPLQYFGFKIKDSEGNYIKASKSNGVYTYTETSSSSGTTFYTDSNGQIIIKRLPIDDYYADEVYTGYNYYYDWESVQNVKIAKPTSIGTANVEITIKNKLTYKSLKVTKTDYDTGGVLSGIGFVFYNNTTGKYLKKSNDSYVLCSSQSDATTFYTNSNGIINLSRIPIGEYNAIETVIPYYGYEKTTTTISKDTTSITITNRVTKIKISGYVWQDIQSSKQSTRNNYYKLNSDDSADTAFNGITVRLKDTSGNTIKTTTTAECGLYSEISGGEYQFVDVERDKLDQYYIEFQYDGLIYQSVTAHIDSNAGSKAVDTSGRNTLDKNFTSVSNYYNNVARAGGYVISYSSTQDHATSISSSNCTLKADTSQASYSLKNNYKAETTSSGATNAELKYVNLGVYKKPQADLALVQDLYNVNVGINGYWHVYNYGTIRISNTNLWDVGVKFKSENTGTYKRALYESDINYTNTDSSKELQVYLTYKIALRNESSYITKVNSIVDYFDNRYTIVAAGTGLDSTNSITGAVEIGTTSTYSSDYNKAVINVNTTISAGNINYIYVQFKLDREAVYQIVNNEETLYNVAEINSYTVYKDSNGNTVAAVDKDSVPGNAKVGDTSTYEDDTDSAPAVQLELAEARKITGTVFEDSTTDSLLTGQIRQGDGIYTTGETTIQGVKVTLHEVNNSIADMVYTTGSNGNFEFSGFIPGQYTITYTWGDGTYTVQDYKGTVYDSSRNQSNLYWYKDNVNTRKTDAIDNYSTRLQIDNQTAGITGNTIYSIMDDAYNGSNSNGIITKMNSTTPTMAISVEYETTATSGTQAQVEFKIKNVDFGIVERARQDLELSKRVSAFKITLANGQTLIEATVDENGKVQGVTNYLTYMGSVSSNGSYYSGFIKAEIDDELIEGSTLEITYEIKAINNSEVEYMSENYYKYGIKEGNIVTLRPSGVVDYLDKNLAFVADKNTQWEQITEAQLKTLNATKVGDTDFLNARTILYTDAIGDILPGKTASINLVVSKLLATSNDLTFYNYAEVTNISKPGVSTTPTGSIVKLFDDDEAEEAIIIPSTGENKSYVVPIVVGITSLIILSTGIIIIKKKVIDA